VLPRRNPKPTARSPQGAPRVLTVNDCRERLEHKALSCSHPQSLNRALCVGQGPHSAASTDLSQLLAQVLLSPTAVNAKVSAFQYSKIRLDTVG
jgi:hypothetical protein